jgi:hypothetical protein
MTQILNRDAYDRAREARIRWNASVTRKRNWEAATPDAKRLEQFLCGIGEFDMRCAHCAKGWSEHLIEINEDTFDAPTEKCRTVTHPVIASAFFGTGGEIASKMRDALHQWGGLTPKQTELVRSMITRAEARVATRQQERAAKLAADQTTSHHIGQVGERTVFTLTVERILTFETQFGLTHINLCRAQDGSVVVYKGSNRLVDIDAPLPALVVCKATVKAHELRDGVAQTIISRPKVSE